MPTLNDLQSVNERINALPYKADIGDDWTPITAAGDDCDSYATAKFEALATMGWPVASLRLATCWTEDTAYHAVLLADLEGQTWVLDNRKAWPIEFELLPYKWDKLQVAGTQDWEKA
jgi:predicted transglutaminase-like cysteine proteinase